MQRDVVRFEKGAVLKSDMLQSLYDHPRFLTESYYAGYPDGILFGLAQTEREGKHIISPGALKLNGEIYVSPRETVVEELPSFSGLKDSTMYYLCYTAAEPQITYSHDVYTLGLSFVTELRPEYFCMRYVKYVLGSISPLDSREVHGLYSSDDGYGFALPAELLKSEILPVIGEKKDKHTLDYILSEHILCRPSVSVSVIMMYIAEYNSSVPDKAVDISPSRGNARELINALKTAAAGLVPKVTYIAPASSEPAKHVTAINKGGKML